MSKKSPQLRFEGFTDDWEQRKLSEGTSKIGDGLHGTPNYSDNGDVFFINGNNLVNGKIVITKETKLVTESNQSKDDKLLNRDTILMSINGTIGNLAWYNNERVMLGKSAAYLTVSNFDKKFIFSYLQTSTIKNYFLNNLTGTTIKNLGLKTIRDTTLFVPTLEEQQKIGSFFKQLDDTIALHQRKLDLLKEQKKGFLQKMFPKNGEKVPELRFAGFADDWEERKLGELGSVAMNRRIFKDQTSENEEVPFFKIGTFGSKPDAFISRELFEEYKLKYPYPEIGDVLISASGSIGRTVVYQGEDEYFQDSNIVWLKHDNRLDNKFLKQFYSIVKWQGLEGSTIKRLYNKNILDTDISIPSTIEQNKIGMFFEQLDDTIALHQRKLDLLKEQKKGFLQKMFV